MLISVMLIKKECIAHFHNISIYVEFMLHQIYVSSHKCHLLWFSKQDQMYLDNSTLIFPSHPLIIVIEIFQCKPL